MCYVLILYGSLNESSPIDSYVWVLGPQLVELFQKDWELQPYWKSCVTGSGLSPCHSQCTLCLLVLVDPDRTDISAVPDTMDFTL